MKALSIRQPYIYNIVQGLKTEEYRTWATPHRGPLLLCASSYKVPQIGKYFITGHAIAIVDITGIEKRYDIDGLYYAWQLDNVRLIKPFPVKGKLHLFDVDDSLIEPLDIPIDDWPYWLIDHGYCEPWPEEMLDRFDAGEFDKYLKWCLTKTGVQTDRNGNIVPVKNQRLKDQKIEILDVYTTLEAR